MRRSDLVFARRVLDYLKATRQEAHTMRGRPGAPGDTIVKPCLTHQRKAIQRARFKRLRKSYKRQGKPVPEYWP